MNEQGKDLAAFEEYLFSFMNEATASTPLTSDEVVAILENYGPPEEISSQEREQVIKRMKEAHQRRMEVANKMQNPDLIRSLGELFQLFCEWKQIPLAWLARLLDMSEGHLEAHRMERASPEELSKEQILNFAALAGIGIPSIVAIIERTFKLLQSKSASNLTAGHPRIYKEATEPQRLKIMENAATGLSLKSDEPDETTQHKEGWEALREDILQEAEKDALLLNQPRQCLTMRNESQRQYANDLLQRI